MKHVPFRDTRRYMVVQKGIQTLLRTFETFNKWKTRVGPETLKIMLQVKRGINVERLQASKRFRFILFPFVSITLDL